MNADKISSIRAYVLALPSSKYSKMYGRHLIAILYSGRVVSPFKVSVIHEAKVLSNPRVGSNDVAARNASARAI